MARDGILGVAGKEEGCLLLTVFDICAWRWCWGHGALSGGWGVGSI